MTSNLGANILLEQGSGPEARAAVMEVVRRHFRPEFLNRIDEIVQFDPLSPEQLRGVARLQAEEINQRLKERSITMVLTDAALDYAVAQAYDQRYGARPLRRWLEHSIVTPLSRMIVGGELPDDSKVVVDAPAGGASGLTFAVQPDEEAAKARAEASERRKAFKKIRLQDPDEDDLDDMDDMED
ncbi:hypothetical protein ABPG77_000398 [Micractinium sp. CCAP 211/92]